MWLFFSGFFNRFVIFVNRFSFGVVKGEGERLPPSGHRAIVYILDHPRSWTARYRVLHCWDPRRVVSKQTYI